MDDTTVDHLTGRKARADIQIGAHAFGPGPDASPLHDNQDGPFRRRFEWRDHGRDTLATTVAPDESEGTGCTFWVRFFPGGAVVVASGATVDGNPAALGTSADPDVDVLDDDAYDGNDEQIEDLKDRVRSLRALMREGH